VTDCWYQVNKDLGLSPRDSPYLKRDDRLHRSQNEWGNCRRPFLCERSVSFLKNSQIGLAKIDALSYTTLPKGFSAVFSLSATPSHPKFPPPVSTLHLQRIPVTKSSYDLVFCNTLTNPSISTIERSFNSFAKFRHNRKNSENPYNRYTLTTDDTNGSPSFASGVRPDFTIKTSPRRGTQ